MYYCDTRISRLVSIILNNCIQLDKIKFVPQKIYYNNMCFRYKIIVSKLCLSLFNIMIVSD